MLWIKVITAAKSPYTPLKRDKRNRDQHELYQERYENGQLKQMCNYVDTREYGVLRE